MHAITILGSKVGFQYEILDILSISRETCGEGRSRVVPGRAGQVRGGWAVSQRGRGRRQEIPPGQLGTQPRRPRNLLIGLPRCSGTVLG